VAVSQHHRRTSMNVLTAAGAAISVVPPRRLNVAVSDNMASNNMTGVPESPSLGPLMAPSPRFTSMVSPTNLDDESCLMNTTMLGHSSGTFSLQPPSNGLAAHHPHHHFRATQHFHQLARWNTQTREEQTANSASAVLRCLNQGFQFKRTLAYYHTMRENAVYRGLVGSSHTRARHATTMHPEIARHVALAAHCLGDWDAVREVCTASGVKRSSGGGFQRYGSMSSEHGMPYPTRNFVSKELLLFSAASDVARGHYDEALETLERLRELLMDAATVLHAESSKRRMDLNVMMLSMTDLEEAMHVLRTRGASPSSTVSTAVADGSNSSPAAAAAGGASTLPQALLNGATMHTHHSPTHARLITIGHRSLPSQASALHVMQAIAFRAAFVPRSKQLRNLFVLCELLTADGQQDRAQEVLRDSLRIAGCGVDDKPSHQRLRSLSVGGGDNRSFPSNSGHLPPTFDPSQFEHQAITLECLKIGLETAGCSAQRLERLHGEVQDALSAVAYYVEENTMGMGLVSPLSTIVTNPSITMPTYPLDVPATAATATVVGSPGEKSIDNSSGGPLRWTHRSSSATNATTTNQQPPPGATVSRGTLEFRVELETLDLEITRRLTGFHQFPTTRRGGRDAPRPSYATPLFSPDGHRLGLYMLTSESDDRDLSVFITKLYKNSEAIVGEHHSVTDANFATSLKEFSLLFFDVCKALRSEWVELSEKNMNRSAEEGGIHSTAGGSDEELQVLQNFLTTSSQCVTALQRAAAMCVKSFDHATTSTVHSLQQQQQQHQFHYHQAAAAAEALAASPTSTAGGVPNSSAAGGSGLAVNISGAGHLAYSSRRRVASARANITVSDLLLKALNTAWNGNCLHDLSLAPDMLPSWALVSPFLAHYASRSKSLQQIVTQMCQQSLGMLSQMSFHLVSSFETVGLRWLPPKDAPAGEGEETSSPMQPPSAHNNHHSTTTANKAAPLSSPQTASLIPPPFASSQHHPALDGVPSPLSRATSNVTSRMVRSRSVMQAHSSSTDRHHPHGSSKQAHHFTLDDEALDLPLETESSGIGHQWTSASSQAAPPPLSGQPGDASGTPPLVMPGAGGALSAVTHDANNLSLALTATSANFTDNNSGTIYHAPFVLTSPDTLQPSRGQSFARQAAPPAMEGLGTSLNLASAGSVSTLALKHHSSYAVGASGPHAAATPITPEAAAAAAQLRLHASLGPHMNMGAWWDLQQRAVTAAAQASRADRRNHHQQQSHRASNATTAFGATAPSQILHSGHYGDKYDSARSPLLVGQHELDDTSQLLQLFPQDSMNDDDRQATTGVGVLDIEHMAGMSLNSPPPRTATLSLETDPAAAPTSPTLRPLVPPAGDERRFDAPDGDSPQPSRYATLAPPPPFQPPHRSMRQRSGSKVFILHDGEEDIVNMSQPTTTVPANITHNNNNSAIAEGGTSPQPLNVMTIAAAAAVAQAGPHHAGGAVPDITSWSPQQHESGTQGAARRRSTLTTAGALAASQQQPQRPSAENNHHQAAASMASSSLPALHHEIVLDIAKTSPQHRSLIYTTLRFSRWMAGGETSIHFIDQTNGGAQARNVAIGSASSSIPIPGAAAASSTVRQQAAPPASGPSSTTASSAWGSGLRGCPLPLPTWHVRQQCAKPIATRATVLSARRVPLTNPAPPFECEELVWMTLSDGTTLKFHHGLTPSLHTPPPPPPKPRALQVVESGGADNVNVNVANPLAGGDTVTTASLLPMSHRAPSCGSIADLVSMATSAAAQLNHNGGGFFTTAQKRARRADEKLDALQQHVHVQLCSCHPFQTTAGSAPAAIAVESAVPVAVTTAHVPSERVISATPLTEFGRFEEGCDTLSPLSAFQYSPPPPATSSAQHQSAPVEARHASACETCGGRVQGKPYATMSAAFNTVIEHLPLHHMRRSLVIPFSPVNSLTQIMTPIPIITPPSMVDGSTNRHGSGAAALSSVASGRPRYIPLRHVTMTSLYHLLDAYSAHRLREEPTVASSSTLFGEEAENNNNGGGAEDRHNNYVVVPMATTATNTTRRQRTNQIRVADYYDSGGVAFKGDIEGVDATLEDLRNVFSEEDAKDGDYNVDAANYEATGGTSRSVAEQQAVNGRSDGKYDKSSAAPPLAAAAVAAAAALATRVNLIRLYRAKPQQYLRQLMVLEAQDPSQWVSSRTVFAKQLAEWSILQYLFDISCRCPAYFVVDLASGHISQLEVGQHALPPPPGSTSTGPNFNASGEFGSHPSSAASPVAPGSSATTGPRQRSLTSGEFSSSSVGGASSCIRSNLATRDPATFRMTTTLQNALPMRSPYSGFLLYASEGLRQAHLVKKELIGLLEYGLEGIRVRQVASASPRPQRRSGAFVSGRSSPASDFGAGMSASSYRAAGGGATPLVVPPSVFSTQNVKSAAPQPESSYSRRVGGSAVALARRVSDSDGGLLSIEPFNTSFADSDQLLLMRSSSPTAAAGIATSNPRHPSQGKDEPNEDWAPTAVPSLEADEEGYSMACFDVSSAIVRLNESLSVASTLQTKQHYDPRRGVVVLSSPSLSPPPPKRNLNVVPEDNDSVLMTVQGPAAPDSDGIAKSAPGVAFTTDPPPMLVSPSGGSYYRPQLHPKATTPAVAHPLTQPLDSFEDFIGCMHSQAATKIQGFVRNRQHCRRMLIAAKRLRRRQNQQRHHCPGGSTDRPLGCASDDDDEDDHASVSLRTTSSFTGPNPRMLNMSLVSSNEGADSRAGGTSAGSFSLRPRTASSASAHAHLPSALQSPQLTFQAHLSSPERSVTVNTHQTSNDGGEGFEDNSLQSKVDASSPGTRYPPPPQQRDDDAPPRPCGDTLIPGVTYHAVKTYQQRVESLIEAAIDEGNIAGRNWDQGHPHPWFVWCPYW
jgi:hypothetical protein